MEPKVSGATALFFASILRIFVRPPRRRWFVLRDNVLMYFASPKDFTGFRDKPSGIVLLEECNVRTREDKGSAQRFQFVLSHPNGESVVLAATSAVNRRLCVKSLRLLYK